MSAPFTVCATGPSAVGGADIGAPAAARRRPPQPDVLALVGARTGARFNKHLELMV